MYIIKHIRFDSIATHEMQLQCNYNAFLKFLTAFMFHKPACIHVTLYTMCNSNAQGDNLAPRQESVYILYDR
jgi:hypothetical protein